MTKFILFDFDGVIANTFDFAYVINKIFKPNLTEHIFKDLFNGNINEGLKEDATEEQQKEGNQNFFKLYRPELMKIRPVPGIDEVIKQLAKKGKLFIVSSTDSQIIKDFLEREGLLACFEEVLGNDVDYSKIKKINMVLRKHNLESGNGLFITDTLGDILEAEKCGVKSIGVSWGYHPSDNLLKGNPLKIVASPKELLRFITELW